MTAFAPVTDAELERARRDSAFRHKLLTRSLEALLSRLQELRNAASSRPSASARQIREGVELAVRLAELIQAPADASRGGS